MNLMSVDSGGRRCSVQWSSLVTFGENGLTLFCPLTFSIVVPGLENTKSEIKTSFFPGARKKQKNLKAAVVVLFYPILFHLVPPQPMQ